MRSPGRAATGLALGAVGVLYSRLSGRRAQQPAQPEAQPRPETAKAVPPEVSPDEVERAKSELADELARRAGSTFPT